jgi:hypothetical protein
LGGVSTTGGATAASNTSAVASNSPQSVRYWIELFRNGKTYRCNNKTSFKSGDAIRFHITPESSGYAYVVMKESSSGKSSVLFPTAQTGTDNFLQAEGDYPLPNKTWLKFDEHPGIERLSLVFSKEKLKEAPVKLPERYLTAYVSEDATGSKDLVPTRMQLSWDDPTPVILPDEVPQRQKSSGSPPGSVRISAVPGESVFAVDIALSHK